MIDEVSFISGSTRLYGILGDPIVQVRSPEMVTAEFHARDMDALLVPLHVPAADFEKAVSGLLALANLDGLILTIPFKSTALALADELGPQAKIAGSINALARTEDGRLIGEVFDGLGCVAGLKAAGHTLAGKRVMLIGAGGAGTAIGVAVGYERPSSIHIVELDEARAEDLAAKIKAIDPHIAVIHGAAKAEGADFILNASPVGMLGDPRNPLGSDVIPSSTIVFDAIVKPEETPLLQAARANGCQIVKGREMMRGQISRIVDFFVSPNTVLKKDVA